METTDIIRDDAVETEAPVQSASGQNIYHNVEYHYVEPTTIEEAELRIRKFFTPPSEEEQAELQEKCEAIWAGKRKGQQAVFSALELLSLPYLLPWAVKDAQRLERFLFWNPERHAIGSVPAQAFDLWGEALQAAIRAFFTYYEDTNAFRTLGTILAKAKHKELLEEGEYINPQYLALLEDDRLHWLAEKILLYDIPTAMKDAGFYELGMFSPKDTFSLQYVQAALVSYLGKRRTDQAQILLLSRCLQFLKKQSKTAQGIRAGCLQRAFQAWCMSGVDALDLADTYQHCLDVATFRDEQRKALADAPVLFMEIEWPPDFEESWKAVEFVLQLTAWKKRKEREAWEKRRAEQKERQAEILRSLEETTKRLRERLEERKHPAAVSSCPRPAAHAAGETAVAEHDVLASAFPMDGATMDGRPQAAQENEAPQKPGFFRRLWNGVKRFFGFGTHA